MAQKKTFTADVSNSSLSEAPCLQRHKKEKSGGGEQTPPPDFSAAIDTAAIEKSNGVVVVSLDSILEEHKVTNILLRTVTQQLELINERDEERQRQELEDRLEDGNHDERIPSLLEKILSAVGDSGKKEEGGGIFSKLFGLAGMALGGIGKLFGGMLGGLTKAIGGISRVIMTGITSLIGLMGGIGGILKNVTKLAKPLFAMIKSGNILGIFRRFLLPLNAIISAIGGIADFFSTSDIADKLGKDGSQVTLIDRLLEAGSGFISRFVGALVDPFLSLFGIDFSVRDLISDSLGHLQQVVSNVEVAFSTDGLTGVIGVMYDTITTFISKAVGGIADTILGVFGIDVDVESGIKGLYDALGGAVSHVFNGISEKGFIGFLGDLIGNLLGAIQSGIVGVFTGVGAFVTETLNSAVGGIKSSVQSLISSITDSVTDTIDALLTWVKTRSWIPDFVTSSMPETRREKEKKEKLGKDQLTASVETAKRGIPEQKLELERNNQTLIKELDSASSRFEQSKLNSKASNHSKLEAVYNKEREEIIAKADSRQKEIQSRIQDHTKVLESNGYVVGADGTVTEKTSETSNTSNSATTAANTTTEVSNKTETVAQNNTSVESGSETVANSTTNQSVKESTSSSDTSNTDVKSNDTTTSTLKVVDGSGVVASPVVTGDKAVKSNVDGSTKKVKTVDDMINSNVASKEDVERVSRTVNNQDVTNNGIVVIPTEQTPPMVSVDGSVVTNNSPVQSTANQSTSDVSVDGGSVVANQDVTGNTYVIPTEQTPPMVSVDGGSVVNNKDITGNSVVIPTEQTPPMVSVDGLVVTNNSSVGASEETVSPVVNVSGNTSHNESVNQGHIIPGEQTPPMVDVTNVTGIENHHNVESPVEDLTSLYQRNSLGQQTTETGESGGFSSVTEFADRAKSGFGALTTALAGTAFGFGAPTGTEETTNTNVGGDESSVVSGDTNTINSSLVTPRNTEETNIESNSITNPSSTYGKIVGAFTGIAGKAFEYIRGDFADGVGGILSYVVFNIKDALDAVLTWLKRQSWTPTVITNVIPETHREKYTKEKEVYDRTIKQRDEAIKELPGTKEMLEQSDIQVSSELKELDREYSSKDMSNPEVRSTYEERQAEITSSAHHRNKELVTKIEKYEQDSKLNPVKPKMYNGSAVRKKGGTTSKEGVDFIKESEGFRSEAYQDEAGVWTIGYGTTRIDGKPVTQGMKINEEQANEYKAKDIQEFEDVVNDSVTVDLAQHERDALVSLAYNIGATAFKNSTVVKRLNEGDREGAKEAFGMWNKVTVSGQKVVSQGLVNRREKEASMFGGEREMMMSGNTVPSPALNVTNSAVNNDVLRTSADVYTKYNAPMTQESPKQQDINNMNHGAQKPVTIALRNDEPSFKKIIEQMAYNSLGISASPLMSG